MSEWAHFETQLEDADVLVTRLYGKKGRRIETVCIRTESADHHLAACHLEGTTLILDLGKEISHEHPHPLIH